VDNHAVADFALVVHRHIRIQEAFIADGCLVSDYTSMRDPRVVADCRVLPYDDVCAEGDIAADTRSRVDNSRWMNTDREWIQDRGDSFQHEEKGDIGIWYSDEGERLAPANALSVKLGRDEYRGSSRGGKEALVLGIRQKRQIAMTCFFNLCDLRDLNVSITDDFPSDQRCYFSNLHAPS
jgi:hypothetical protein